ncbi:MAG: dihydrodipicolinate synthase family protein [Oscillospiraceae bacterium]|nr:dihydrodipicolinate synthase family protein [Oscillospiraceae bacterium]
MSNLTKYQGIFPAFYACYDDHGEVSGARTRALTEHLIQKGVKGVYVGGSSGECIYQSVADRKLVLENVMDAAQGRLTVIAHVACNNTRDSQELARHAEKLGVDAIASIPPIYFHLPEASIAGYWNDISAAAPNTDFIIYNIPQLAGVALTMPLLREMLKNPRVVGVKNSSMPVQDIQMFKDEGTKNGRGFVVFNGPDEQLISGLIMGADGGIGGTYGAMPELILKLYALTKEGKLDDARKLQYDVDNIIYALCAPKCNMYASIKEVLRRREGLDIGGVRAPLANYAPADDEKIAYAVKLIDEAMKRWA